MEGGRERERRERERREREREREREERERDAEINSGILWMQMLRRPLLLSKHILNGSLDCHMDCTLSRWLKFPLPTALPRPQTRLRPLGTVITHSGMGPVGQAPDKFKDLTWLRIHWGENWICCFNLWFCVGDSFDVLKCFEFIFEMLQVWFGDIDKLVLYRTSTRAWTSHRWSFESNSFPQRHEVCAIICVCAGIGKAKYCCKAIFIFS